jgi:hypothetical protein
LKACFCHFIEWGSSAGLKSIAAGHMSQGSGIVGPRHWQRTQRPH